MTCENCIWKNDCTGDYEVCEDFAPYDEFDDEYVGELIERGRREFYEEWFEYISEE